MRHEWSSRFLLRPRARCHRRRCSLSILGGRQTGVGRKCAFPWLARASTPQRRTHACTHACTCARTHMRAHALAHAREYGRGHPRAHVLSHARAQTRVFFGIGGTNVVSNHPFSFSAHVVGRIFPSGHPSGSMAPQNMTSRSVLQPPPMNKALRALWDVRAPSAIPQHSSCSPRRSSEPLLEHLSRACSSHVMFSCPPWRCANSVSDAVNS